MTKTWPFVLSLAGMSVSAAVLILLVPSLFGSGEQVSVEALVVLACLAGVFAVGARLCRPSSSGSDGG
ncbi:hypothetical protein ACHAAC_16700 [Aeromicrobium sp. CF4.19]|uniref:hypothetical protein n=1 Tax=Aeromicrobium sp. CF4.19 TaxID=3373082 RepID=UPI003EE5FBE0